MVDTYRLILSLKIKSKDSETKTRQKSYEPKRKKNLNNMHMNTKKKTWIQFVHNKQHNDKFILDRRKYKKEKADWLSFQDPVEQNQSIH